MAGDSARVLVVGGGIAGLAAAYRLQRTSPWIDMTLIEGERYLGGKIRTARTDGFVLEAGPDSFLSSKPAGLDLCQELGLGDRLQGTNDANRRTFVLCGGRLHLMPEGLTGLVPSRLEPLLQSSLFTPEGKERLGREPDIPPGTPAGDESLASFVERRFGREVYDRLIEPLMAGIYAGDGECLSLEATFPQLRRLEQEHGGVIKGLEAAGRPGDAAGYRPKPAFLSPRGGMAEISKTLSRRLDSGCVRLSTRVLALRETSGGFTAHLDSGERLHADAVICATPAPMAADLIAEIDGELAANLAGIHYVSTASVSIAFRERDLPRPLDGFGYVVPRREGRPILACTWMSSKFEHRAPPGCALLRLFVGREGMQDALAGTDRDLLHLAQEELREVLDITAPPLLHRIWRWPDGMPQYTLGHLDRLRRVSDGLHRHPGLFLAGSAFRGVGFPDCILSGETAARDASRLLQERAERRHTTSRRRI